MDEQKKEFSLETAISSAIKIPGVKVNRNSFLAARFSDPTFRLYEILENGPVAAGVDRETLNRMGKRLILERTSESTALSFAAGIPGGLAMAATIPADVLQFFGMTLRLAQELSYLYGAQDLWVNGELDNERVRNTLILYCGVMFGATGAAAGVRVLSTQLAKTALKKLPQKALTKTFWYPILKKIANAIGTKMTKTILAGGVSKVIPVVGGVISGTITFASMKPMAEKLHKELDKASFDYTEEEFYADLGEIGSASENEEPSEDSSERIKKTVKETFSGILSKLPSLPDKREKKPVEETVSENEDVFGKLEKLKKLEEAGIITEEEFSQKKAELLARL